MAGARPGVGGVGGGGWGSGVVQPGPLPDTKITFAFFSLADKSGKRQKKAAALFFFCCVVFCFSSLV